MRPIESPFKEVDVDIFSLVSLVVAAVSCAAAIVATIVAYTAYRKQTNPEVIAYAGTANGVNYMNLFIANIGSAPAWDVRIRLDEGLPHDADLGHALEEGPLGNGIPFLPPGGSRQVPLGASHRFLDLTKGRSFMATVTYYRSRGRLRKALVGRFPIEGDSYAGTTVVRPPLKEELQKIASGIDRISKGK